MSNPSGQRIPVNRYGLTEVYAPEDAKPTVDVVFVHGLNGDPHNTWTSETSNIFWPAQILPPILEDENARVLVYGYDADVTSFTGGTSKDKIHNHAEQLVQVLQGNRRIRKATERPIIWVTHSLGGLVVKRALIHSNDIKGAKTEHLRSIYVSTYGILFLGTPHHGSDVAQWGNRLEWICSVMLPKKVIDTQPQLVDALKTNNETLQNIDRQFVNIMGRFHIFFFHEGKPTNLKGTLRFIVDETSASPSYQDVERGVIQADHSHMCKFENDNAPGFDLVAEAILRSLHDLSVAVSNKNVSMSQSVNISLTDSKADISDTSNAAANPQASKPSEPYFIVPPGFRPNSFFVGMEKELHDMDRRLLHRRRHDGTACVLVHGQPGGGKSHLVRQYVNKNRKKFSGGVFWVVSHLKEEREQAFEAIYQKAVVRESPETSTKIIKGRQSFVESVKAWFESRQEWLIVFDGVTIETDADVTDLATFVPDSRNSSLIYISRQRNLESKQRLLRPHAIRVPVLKTDDARKLLFKELRIRKPTKEQIEHGTKLVRQVDCLPLAINAISHRIADTHEPLVRYSMKSFSSSPKLEGTYNQILDDMQRLGRMEAWNLIHVLAFYGQHVPVEMLHLGVRALQDQDVPDKSREGMGKPDLNVTFGILMRHALLERNEPKADTSSSHDSLVEPEPIDMLKIHSVVQSFCRDSLNNRDILPEWLQHATQILQYSYNAADNKIKQKNQPARVSDYRYYLVHCRRLYEHAAHYESKKQSLAPIRAELKPLLETIEHQISLLEPGSSQESINMICQLSIFDRTTSSSDSVPSVPSINEAKTPSHRPSPLPLAHETLWGTDTCKPSLESPASIGSAARTPRVVGHSPYQGFHDDFGYESDREQSMYTSQPMRKNLSEATERPHVHGKEHHEDGWQLVSSNKRERKARLSRDLGSFRPSPARATRAEVNRRSVIGTVGRSSDAKRALSEVHSRSPPPSRRSLTGNVASFWQRKPLASTTNSQPTWANVAAGQAHYPRVQPTPPATVPAIVPTSATPDSATNRQRNQFSSPLVSEVHPGWPENGGYGRNSGHLSQTSGSEISPRTDAQYYATPPSGSTPGHSQPRYMANEPFYQPTPITGPNPSRIPYETIDDNISISSSKRPLPEDFRNDNTHPTPYPTSAPPYPQAYSSPYPPYEANHPTTSHLPAGYTSQPMSRDTSYQSRISAAETEPPHFPPSYYYYASNSYTIEPPSPRDRFPNGRPLRKSPRSEHAFSITSPPSNRTSPHDLSKSLPGIGGWTYQDHNNSHPNTRSSSGPGVAIDDSFGHGGLAIVPFDGRIRFGEHDPFSIEEARRRTEEWEWRLARESAATSRSRERSRGAPYLGEDAMATWYPEVNLIPMQSSPEGPRVMPGDAERR
ncbi:MAG: hypothetical protein Q9184_006133 [Pyrenodesmia sp. 2 TL-2023]